LKVFTGIISLILKHTFSPPSNARLAHLCGPTDEHLRTVEIALQVKIAHRHEQFKIEGAKPRAERRAGSAAGPVRDRRPPHLRPKRCS
jgi:phosphate starvation-inducible PhoH-like protein